MKSFNEYLLQERALNIFKDDREEREFYADTVYNILQDSYRSQGGIKGSGLGSPQEMIEKIPFWKLIRKGGKIVAVVMYKDKAGRKSVAFGTNGTIEGKKAAAQVIWDEFKTKRSWKEVSGRAWGFIKKIIPHDMLMELVIPVDKVKQLLPKKDVQPAFGIDKDIKSTDPFKDYYYMHEVGNSGEVITKIALGEPGKTIR